MHLAVYIDKDYGFSIGSRYSASFEFTHDGSCAAQVSFHARDLCARCLSE